MDPAPTRTASGEPSHPDAILTTTRDQNPDDHEQRRPDERSRLDRRRAQAVESVEDVPLTAERVWLISTLQIRPWGED